MLLFVAGFVCFRLEFGWLAALFYAMAGNIMLFAFGLLLLSGVLALLAATLVELRAYFRQDAAALRQILAAQIQKHNLTQRVALEIRQIQFFNSVKRRRLLIADNKKQLRELHQNIVMELESVRPQMPAGRFAEIRKTLRRHLRQDDVQAMLALRRQINCL